MVVKNNMSSVSTLNQLNKNSSELAKSLKRVSTGMKINGAGDDASGYSISERMQVRIRGLRQCDDNTTTGKNMINVAEGGVDEQIEIMKKIREIAMKASDDTYSQTDRDILQKEVNQLLMQSNAISYDTDYNGMPLLSGIVPGKQITQFDANINRKDNDTGIDVVPQPPQGPGVVNINQDDDGGNRGITGSVPIPYYCPKPQNKQIFDPTTTVQQIRNINFQGGSAGISAGSTVYDSSGTAYTVAVPTSGTYAGYLTVTQGGNPVPIVDSNGYGYDTANNIAVIIGTGFQPYTSTYQPTTFTALTAGTSKFTTSSTIGHPWLLLPAEEW